MTPQDAYHRYLALKTHFTKDYDFFKHGGLTRATDAAFKKRKDRMWFELASKKMNLEDYTDTYIAYVMINMKLPAPRDLIDEQAMEDGLLWTARKKNYVEVFRRDVEQISKRSNGVLDHLLRINQRTGQPELLRGFYLGSVTADTMILFDREIGHFDDWDKLVQDSIWSKTRDLFRRLSPFVQFPDRDLQEIIGHTFIKRA